MNDQTKNGQEEAREILRDWIDLSYPSLTTYQHGAHVAIRQHNQICNRIESLLDREDIDLAGDLRDALDELADACSAVIEHVEQAQTSLAEADGENVHDLTSQDCEAYAQIAAAQYVYTPQDVMEVPPGERLLDHDRAELAIFRYLREQAAAMAEQIESEYVREWTS